MFKISNLRRLRRPTFTELTISAAAIAVAAAIVLPFYDDHLKRSHRASARAALLHATQWMERTATARGRYPAAAAIPDNVMFVKGGRYTMVVTSTDGLTYTLTALPHAEQADDLCGSFRINQAGLRLQVATAEVPTPLSTVECWVGHTAIRR